MAERALSATRVPRWGVAIEVAVAAALVLLDVGLPSALIVLLAAGSLVVRRTGPVSLGFHRPRRAHLLAGTLTFAVLWSLLQLGVTMPLANHLSGERQNLGVFADVEGDVGLLVVLVALSWTLGALVEETAFRGFLFSRLRELAGPHAAGVVVAVLVSSVLFGVLHSEQGLVGVVVVSFDATAFCLLRLHYGTVWASVLAHGFMNTLGLLTFFVVGPVYGLW